jgi:hypothetical protein
MAKQQIRTYVYTPGTTNTSGKIEIQGKWDLNQILLITNATRNTILYNFADPQFSGTSVTFTQVNSVNFPTARQTGDGTTTVTLAAYTAGQSSTDSLQILVERAEQIIRPWPLGTDAFERMRTAGPQSMLDADFEYGLQPTKWQTLDLVRGCPSIYEIPGSDINVSSITSDASNAQGGLIESLITVTTNVPHNLLTTSTIVVAGLDTSVSGYSRAEGVYIVNSVTSVTTFNYYARAQVGSTSSQQISTPYTVLRRGGFYSGISQTPTYSVSGGGATSTATITLTFSYNHGFIPGDGILSIILSDNGSNNHTLAQGPFFINQVPSPTTLVYFARGLGSISGTPVGQVTTRGDAFFIHRPIDGGVSLGCKSPTYGSQAVRMSKKYIRYQSGKAINYNTAALFAPNYDVRSVTATNTIIGSQIYITTDDLDHNLQANAVVQLNGMSSQPEFVGTYTVYQVVDERTFIVLASTTLSTTTPIVSPPTYINHVSWIGATVRAGTFDDQNGMFWQYDGQNMAVGLRSSTFQLAGTMNLTTGTTLVTGNYSRWDQQLQPGDRFVVKGMTHVVTAITSATQMYINPPFRGVSNVTAVKAAKTSDTIVPNSQWNIDRCDGSLGPFNPSGYTLLPWKMQMVCLQWTWYGAGFIEYMLRDASGSYIPVHRIRNSNIRTEAYMRSGNQPVRYEVQNESIARSTLYSSIGTSDVSMTLNDVTNFQSSGTVFVDSEIITYNGKSTSTGIGSLLNLTRGTTLNIYASGSLRNFGGSAASAHTAGSGVVIIGITATPTISHWGSAFLTDGGFDQDRGYIFSYQSTNVAVSTRKTTAFAIRLAPSVSNAITGDLGIRDLINRSQLLLQTIENTVGGASSAQQAVVIEGVLNPSNYPSNFNNISWYPLQGTPSGGAPLGSGQPSFSQIAPGTGIVFDGQVTYTRSITGGAAAASTVISVDSTATIGLGDAVTTTVPTAGGFGLAGNSVVSAIGAGQITITQPILTTLTPGTNLTFYRNQWAVPGETIFSFISSPSTKDSLDLSALKELANSPLGGRGTFPNGPDTLFINVYLTSGTPVQSNLVLRWGEAQA